MNPIPDFVVVGKQIGQRLIAPNALKPTFGGGDRGAKRECDTFLPIGNQRACKKIAGSTDGFQFRAEIPFRNGAIEAACCTD